MKRLTSKTQTGIGLIEVLITTVVVAVGLIAIASLQTELLSSSGESKIRSEARVLAERKIEALRNNINLAGYNTINAGKTTESNISGKNATFERITTITDKPSFLASSAYRKNVSIKVSWGNGPDENVSIVTEMAWVDPADSARLANSNGGLPPVIPRGPRGNASEDVDPENVDAHTPTPLPGTVTVQPGSNGALPSAITISVKGGGQYELKPITTELPATHFYSTSIGNGIVAVFLCEDNGTCTYVQNHNGGVSLRVAGTVYSTSGNDLNNTKVVWSNSNFTGCYNGPVTGSTATLQQKPYECVFAGNCNATTDKTGTNCSAEVTDTQINNRRVVPGGEYGTVGLLGLAGQGSNREQACFLEDTADPADSILLQVKGNEVLNEDYLSVTSKRSYAARKIKTKGSINTQVSEGINHSYTNHNFLIVKRGSGNTANAVCNQQAAGNNIVLAPREIIRTLKEADSNTVLPEWDYTGTVGTAKTFIGSVSGSTTNLRMYIEEIGSCYLNNNATSKGNSNAAPKNNNKKTASNNNNQATSSSGATGYACVVDGSATSVTIKGASNEYPAASVGSCVSSTASPGRSGCDWSGNFK